MSDTPIMDAVPHNVAALAMKGRALERQLAAERERADYWKRCYNRARAGIAG